MQNDTEKIIEEYISKAPEAIKNFIASGDWKKDIVNITERFNLDGQKRIGLENEIIFVLIGMEPKQDLAENLKNELGIDANEAGWIAEDVEKSIFSQVSAEIDSMWQMAEQEEQPQPQNAGGVGNEFEQIILNQARAMQPATAPNNLPVSDKPRPVHDYKQGEDPYREPLG